MVSEPPPSIARRAEEALGFLERVRVHTADRISPNRNHDVVRPAQPGDGSEQNHDVFPVLDHPFGFFDHHIRHLHVAVRRLVEGGGDDLRDFDVFLLSVTSSGRSSISKTMR